MAKKENVLGIYRDRALEKISRDAAWYHKFLEYCGRGNIHKLSFQSQLVLFEQKPFATVIAGFNAWNKGMGNRILYGRHGAGIYEEPGMSFKGNLERNVFDITETDNKNPVILWQLEADQREGLAYYLTGTSDLIFTIQTAVHQYLNGMLNLAEGREDAGGIKEQMENIAIPEGLSKEDVTNFINDSILEMVLRRMGFEGENAYTGDYSRIFEILDDEERKRFISSVTMYASHAGKEITLFFRDQIYQLNKKENKKENTERKQTDGNKGNDNRRSIPDEPAEGTGGGRNQTETYHGEETVRADAVYLPSGEAGSAMPVLNPDRGDAAGAGENRGEGQENVKPKDNRVPETPQEHDGESHGRSENYRKGQGDIYGTGYQGNSGNTDVGEERREELLSEKDQKSKSAEIPARDFYYDLAPEDNKKRHRGYGSKAAFSDNVTAIRLLKVLEEQERNADISEQAILSRYTGFGGLPQAFDEKNEGWKKEYRELRELLTEEEYQAARASTVTAFYTDRKVIEAVYDKLISMGFSGGNILEPALGIGNFSSGIYGKIRGGTGFTFREDCKKTASIGIH